MSRSPYRHLRLATGLSLTAGVLGAATVVTPTVLGPWWAGLADGALALAACLCAYAAGVNTERVTR